MSDFKDGRPTAEDGRQPTAGRLDAAIDRAVREMLDVEPPAGLRGRVGERIQRSRPVSGRWTWALVPAMAAIVLAIVLPWRRAAVAPIPSVAVATAAHVPEAPVGRPSPVVSVRPRAEAVRAESAPRRAPRVVMAETTAASEAGDETLASIDPIGITPIGSPSIVRQELAIRPLASIPQIRVELLSPPDGRN